MKIIIAPDSFKGSISSLDAAAAMGKAARGVFPAADIVEIPIADGGEGTLEVFLSVTGGEAVYRDVTGPLGDHVRAETGVDVGVLPGSGAAGGIAAPLFAIGKCTQRLGINIVLDMTGFDRHLADADLVLTGEGRIDGQALYGKVLTGIGKRCLERNVPVFAFAGSIGEEAGDLQSVGISAVFSIANGPVTLAYAMEHAGELIESGVGQVMKAIRAVL